MSESPDNSEVQPRAEVHFYCTDCRTTFKTVPDRVEDEPAWPWHPFRYFATKSGCPCGLEKPQAVWERNLFKAHVKATGPKTDEGKAISAANLDGHPTPEEARITRLNALSHGLYAKTAPYFPAKPGKFPHCATCEQFNNGCNDEEHAAPGHKNPPACVKRVELQMRYLIAFEHKSPEMLNSLQAEFQARVAAIIDSMILKIMNTGVEIRTPEWHFDKDGDLHIAEYYDENVGEKRFIEKVQAHPLLKPLIEMMKANGMTLPDSGMTLRSQDDHDLIQGHLNAADATDLTEFQRRQTEATEQMVEILNRAQESSAKDPVLLEHESQEAIGNA